MCEILNIKREEDMRMIHNHKLPCLHCQPHGFIRDMRRIQNHKLPCLHCQPHGFIRMVHHLIERCMLFRMGRDDCIRTLANHADIHPIVTLTVWEELHKENKSFFQAYSHSISPNKSWPQEIGNVNHHGRTWTSHRRWH